MRLTVSKRFEFSASRRLFQPEWTEQQNLAAFGRETLARYGTGRNYAAYFVFSGPVNSSDGMVINVTDIKQRISILLRKSYDHKFLNEDTQAFANYPPTVERVATQLLAEAIPLFDDLEADLVACHLAESPEQSATAYNTGLTEVNYWVNFSAARQTMSPRLTEEENRALFGLAASPSGHGHNYRARITVVNSPEKEPLHEDIQACLDSITKELDHRNLNTDVPGLSSIPKTTECLARYLCERAGHFLPVARVRLHERDDFFAEYNATGNFSLGLQEAFNAAHRLHSDKFSETQNEEIYGKCHNFRGHGHRYLAEATVGGVFDEKSGTLCSFDSLRDGLRNAIEPWQDKHLDQETTEFQSTPSTGENIVQHLWPKADAELSGHLSRLRLWETPNNRFTLRR